MKTRVLMAAIAAATLILGLHPGTALANRPVYTLTGQVSTPPVNNQITVNGQTFNIAAGSDAATEVNTVVQGESVQIVLSGPPNSNTTEVVAIYETPSN